MSRAACAVIHSKALQHNLQCVRNASPDSRILAIIKANGYGHGIVRVAQILHQADGFGVASLDEAVVLRQAGIDNTIVLLEGFADLEELRLASQYQLDVVVHQQQQVDLIINNSFPAAVSIWLKLDTGMHRLGLSSDSFRVAAQQLQACDWINTNIRFMTHFACADDRDNDMTRVQLRRFETTVAGLAGDHSLANSAAILGWPAAHGQWLRPGIMLYGVSPFTDSQGAAEGLQAAMTLKSRLIAVNHYHRGETVGYGASWSCPEDMPIGVVAIGYGDGYPRHAPSGTPVLVNGKRVPMAGRVSMDMITVDLRTQPDANIGDEVILWGDGLAVEEIARLASTIAYELLCHVSQRVHMIDNGE